MHRLQQDPGVDEWRNVQVLLIIPPYVLTFLPPFFFYNVCGRYRDRTFSVLCGLCRRAVTKLGPFSIWESYFTPTRQQQQWVLKSSDLEFFNNYNCPQVALGSNKTGELEQCLNVGAPFNDTLMTIQNCQPGPAAGQAKVFYTTDGM